MAVRQQQRRGTASQWTSSNPILSAAEIGYETDTNKFKIGDGTNRWSTLSYFVDLDTMIAGAPGLLNSLDEIAAAINDDPTFFTTIASSMSSKAPLASPTFTGTVSGVTKSMVGLGNVDNTSDASKPVSTATQAALDLKANSADITELSQDAVNSALNAGSGITKTYNDAANTITIAVDSTIATKTYADDKATTAANAAALDATTKADAAKTFATAADAAVRTAVTTEIGNAISTEVTNRNAAITTAVANVVNAAPEALDTLKELADALTADEGTASTLATLVGTKASSSQVAADIAAEATARNTAIATAKSEAISTASSDATNKANNAKSGAEATASTALSNHEADTTNIHGIADTSALATKTYADNAASSAVAAVVGAAPESLNTLKELADALTADESTAASLATLVGTKAPLASPTFTGTVSGVTKSMVGLGNVDNTADSAKPVSTATQSALDLKLASATAASTYETISNVALKAPLASPALTGTPTSPTAALGTNTTQVATTAFVKAAIQDIASLNLVLDGGGV
jgi:hypothetical protein